MYFFFFSSRRRHTRYIGDWSSDVCSSDLRRLVQAQLVDDREELVGDLRDRQVGDVDLVLADQVQQQVEWAGELLQRSEERRVGKECWCGGSQDDDKTSIASVGVRADEKNA